MHALASGKHNETVQLQSTYMYVWANVTAVKLLTKFASLSHLLAMDTLMT